MPWFEISLIAKKNVSRSRFEDNALSWIISLIKFEHINNKYSIVWKGKSNLVIEVEATRNDSLSPECFNKYVFGDYQIVLNLSACAIKITIIDYYANKKNFDLNKAKELYLFATLYQDLPCLKEGANETPIPAFLLPMDPDRIERIYFWKELYQNHASIEIASRKLEIPAYKQLALPKSGLSEEGRGLCKEIELATKKPTYYFLFRYWGWKNINKEFNRPCPSCGKPWKNKTKTRVGINSFDFKCIPCRLVSNYACTFDNEKYAQIGYSK